MFAGLVGSEMCIRDREIRRKIYGAPNKTVFKYRTTDRSFEK
jgi:hypothetical protein